MKRIPLIPFLVALAASCMAVGCPEGGSLQNSDRFLGVGGHTGADCDARPIFEESCGSSSCHAPKRDGGPPAGVTDLISPGVEARLLDMPAAAYGEVDNPGDCPTGEPGDEFELLINSANPEASLILTKTLNTHRCGEGMPYPYNSRTQLPESELSCIDSWLRQVIAAAEPSGPGGAPGQGGQSGSGGDSASGGTQSGGTTGTGGMTTTMPPADVSITATCALAPGGDCGNGIVGSENNTDYSDMTNSAVGHFAAGSWIAYSGIDMTGYDRVTVSYGKGNTTVGTVELRSGSVTGTLLGSWAPANTGAWNTYVSVNIDLTAALSGSQDLYFVGVGATDLCNIQTITLTQK